MHGLVPEIRREYHVFLASPSDTHSECELVRRALDSVNRTIARHYNIHFTLIRGMTDTDSGLGRGQARINEQAILKHKSTLALFIGIMRNSFGSPSGAGHPSGTVEELETVRKLRESQLHPDIKWFFCKPGYYIADNGAIAQGKHERAQRNKINKLKKRFRTDPDLQLLYKEYTPEEFYSTLIDDLMLWIVDSARPWANQPRPAVINAEETIEIACSHITEGNTDVAFFQLSELRHLHWACLSPYEKFRTLANLGHVFRLRKDYGRAAELFLEAKEHAPDIEKARSLESFGYYLQGNDEEARTLAAAVLTEYPESALAMQVWLMTLSAPVLPEAIEPRLTPSLLADPGVLFALSRRAMESRDRVRSEKHAREALRHAPNDPAAQLLLAEVLLYFTAMKLGPGVSSAHLSVNREELGESKALLTLAVESYKRTGALREAATTLVNRSLASRLLGETAAAVQDLATAASLQSHDPAIVNRYVSALWESGSQDHLIDLLDRLYIATEDTWSGISLATLLEGRGCPSDLLQAADIVTKILAKPESVLHEELVECFFLLLAIRLSQSHPDPMSSVLLQDSLGLLQSSELMTLRAVGALRCGQPEQASAHGMAALAELREPGGDIARRLGNVFVRLQMPAEAFSALRLAIKPDRADKHAPLLLACARECGEDAFILKFASALRSNGIHDIECIIAEADILVKYDDHPAAIRILDATIAANVPDDVAKALRLRRALLLLDADMNGMADVDINTLPAVEEVNPTSGLQMVQLLRQTKGGMTAAGFAYSLYRRFPDTPQSHMAVIMSFSPGTDNELELPIMSTVQPGCAVVYLQDGATKQEWYIIEDLPGPKASLGEVSPAGPIGRELQDKAAGDRFVLNPGGIQERCATVVAVMHKYVRRFLDCFWHWESRFPDIRFVQSMDTTSEKSGEHDFSAFFALLDREEERREAALALYRAGQVPVYLLARALAKDVVGTLALLAGSDRQLVHCTAGRGQEVGEGIDALRNADAVVVDITAVATLIHLDALQLLERVPLKLIGALGTKNELLSYARKLESRQLDHHVTGKQGTQYVVAAVSGDDVRRYRERVLRAVEVLDQVCTWESGTALAGFAFDRRELLVSCFGRASAESIALTQPPCRVLWADDRALGEMGAAELNAARVWTQLVGNWLAARGDITAAAADQLTLHLIGAGYTFTALTPSVVLLAATEAGWDSSVEPLRCVVAHFAVSQIDAHSIWLLSGHSLALAWRSSSLIDRLQAFTHALCVAVSQRPDGERILLGLRRSVDAFFRLDVVHAAEVRRILDGLL